MGRIPSDDPYAGIYQRRGAWYLRIRFAGCARPHEEHGFPTRHAALKRMIELRDIRDRGLTPSTAPAQLALRDVAQAFLDRKLSTPRRKTGRRLTPNGAAWWERSTRPWRSGELASMPLRLVPFHAVETWQLARYRVAPKACHDEIAALKAILRYAAQRGQDFDQALLGLDQLAVEVRRRLALEPEELDWFLAHVPAYARRMPSLQATVGLRIGELFTLEDHECALDGDWPTILIPAAKCKEQRDKVIDLTPPEAALVRAQLTPVRLVDGDPPPRAAGTTLVFPTLTGKRWTHSQFDRLVWQKAKTRAAEAWRLELGDGATPFDDITTHDLRATAVTLMRDALIPEDVCAARVGHADGGRLIREIYDARSARDRARLTWRRLAPRGIRDAAEAAQRAPNGAPETASADPLEGSP